MLITVGIALAALGIVEWRQALEWARGHSHGWQLPVAIVLAQLALYTFGQPGSTLFWVAALLYSPSVATLMLTAGGTSGALGAYLFARRLTQPDPARAQPVFRLIERHGDFFTLCALRILPGMPHSVINYASGMLALPLLRFLFATALGLAIKSYLYASAIDGAIETATPSDLLRIEVLGPLIIIAFVLLLGRFAVNRAARARSTRRPTPRPEPRQ
jgi:uncharacterized membrane protein YdjX (TVP38/TMEM64 family)